MSEQDYTDSPEGQHAMLQAQEDARVDAERPQWSRCTECRHEFSPEALATEPKGWGHPCYADGKRIKKGVTPCESYREPFVQARASPGATDGDAKLEMLARAMRKVLPPALLTEVLGHLDPLTPFLRFLQTFKDEAAPPVATTGPDEPTLEQDIASALNRHSAENASNTPDYLLAQFLIGCLTAWNQGVQQRETWYGRDARPSSVFDDAHPTPPPDAPTRG